MSGALLQPEQVLLLRAALLQGPQAMQSFAAWQRAVPFDTIDANALRLVPLLYRNLHAQGCDDPLMGRMKGLWRRSWVENRMRIDACTPVLAALAQAGIPTLLLKGAAMLARWVDDLGVRPMADFDILVPRARARAALAVMIAAEWTPILHLWRTERFDESDIDAWHGAALRKDGYEIDLHWRVLHEGASASGNDSFWACAIPARLGDVATSVLAPEDHLFHAAIHGADWGAGGRIDWAADAMLLLRAARDGFDWSRVAQLARTQRLGAPLEALLATLRFALDAPVPQQLIARRTLRPAALVEGLEFRLRRRPPHRVGAAGRGLLALQDYRRRSAGWIERPLLAAVPAFGQQLWQLDRGSRVPAFAAFVALGRPPALRRPLANDVRPQRLARRDLPDLSAPRLLLDDSDAVRGALVLGWSVPERGGGRWTDGDEALIALRAAGHAAGDLPIALRLRPFAHARHPPIAVEVWANDRPAATWRFAQGDGSRQTRALVVGGALLASRPVLSLGLRIHRAGTPAALGLSADVRRLGLFVEELRFAPAAPADAFARPLEPRAGSPDAEVLWEGWSAPEAEGCWTCAPHASIRLRLPEPAPRGLDVELHARPYVASQRPALSVAVSAGGTGGSRGSPLLQHSYGPHDAAEPLRFTAPASALASGVLDLSLDIADPIAPAEAGDSADPRPLGLLVQRLVLRPR